MSKTFNIGIKSGALFCEDCKKGWCEHLDDAVTDGVDAMLLHPGVTLDVPVFPTKDIFIQLTIGRQLGSMNAAPMSVTYTPDIGATKTISLGLWVEGDGVRVIRGIILDFVRSQSDPADFNIRTAPAYLSGMKTKCPFKNHIASIPKLGEIPAGPNERWLYAWSIVWERACPVCVEGTADVTGESAASLSDLGTYNPRSASAPAAGRRTPASRVPTPKPTGAWKPADAGLGDLPF